MKVYVLKRESDGQYLTIWGMGGMGKAEYSTELHEAIRYSEKTMPVVGKKYFIGYVSSLLGEKHRLVSVVKRKAAKGRRRAMKTWVYKRVRDGQYLVHFAAYYVNGGLAYDTAYSPNLHEACRYNDVTHPDPTDPVVRGWMKETFKDDPHRLVYVVKRKQRTKKVVYIAHALSGLDREKNIERAKRWVLWAAEDMGVCPIADWILLASQWDESKRELGLSIDIELVRRADEVWLCGTQVSPGMQTEWAHASVVRDLTVLPSLLSLVDGGPPPASISLDGLPSTRWTKP
jgi:hypothetical protein